MLTKMQKKIDEKQALKMEVVTNRNLHSPWNLNHSAYKIERSVEISLVNMLYSRSGSYKL
ncbi:hypothetical protein SD074_30000 [Prolixibacter sp. SD074]|nr:hypothetical protein SD074_30000 [Prolixibacter sp. SD074]